MKKIETLTQLKNAAIVLTHPIKVRWPQFNKEEILTIDTTDLVNNTYNTNNGTLAFFTDGALYVIPWCKMFAEILVENGFTRRGMYVPFSNWDYPVAWESKWNDLKRTAKECA